MAKQKGTKHSNESGKKKEEKHHNKPKATPKPKENAKAAAAKAREEAMKKDKKTKQFGNHPHGDKNADFQEKRQLVKPKKDSPDDMIGAELAQAEKRHKIEHREHIKEDRQKKQLNEAPATPRSEHGSAPAPTVKTHKAKSTSWPDVNLSEKVIGGVA